MMYVDFRAGDKDYKLRLATRNIVALEKAIGCNPVTIFGMGGEDVHFPTITIMVNILWQSLQKFHHGISLTDAQDIFDEYLEDHEQADFIKVIIEIYKVSGLMKDANEAKTEDEKN